mmetsp:Transcript_22230/g.61907  ORF Transcript_22230/g.61907 Transcript_22230/m.61907 type:complete len:272 (-) Transcript_22230:1959-2774(-)
MVGALSQVGEQVLAGPGIDCASVRFKVRPHNVFVNGSGRFGQLHENGLSRLVRKQLAHDVVFFAAQHKGSKELLELFVGGLFVPVLDPVVDKVFEHLLGVVVLLLEGRPGFRKQGHDEGEHVEELLRIVLHGSSGEEQAVFGLDPIQHFVPGGFGIFEVVSFVHNQVVVRKVAQKLAIRGVFLLKIRDGRHNDIERCVGHGVLVLVFWEVGLEAFLDVLSLRLGTVVLDDVHFGTEFLEFPDPVGERRHRNDNEVGQGFGTGGGALVRCGL